jgi:hypothetical protein
MQNSETNSANSAESVNAVPGPAGDENAAVMNPDTALQKLPQDIAALGKQFASIDILNFLRGMAITNQMETAKRMQALGPQIDKLEKKQRKKPADHAAMARLTDSFSRLSFQLSQSGCHLLEIEKLSPSSKPGSRIPLNQTCGPREQVRIVDSPPKSTSGV